MADADTTPANLLFLAAANPALAATGDQEWDTRFAEWLRKDGLTRADIDFGVYAKADHTFEWAKMTVEDTYGRNWRTNPQAAATMDAAYEVMEAANAVREKAFIDPMWMAAVELALTPAPNLACALFKIELIKREELDNFTHMPRDPFEIVAEDMARLATREAA